DPCPVSISPRRNARTSSPPTAGLPTPRPGPDPTSSCCSTPRGFCNVPPPRPPPDPDDRRGGGGEGVEPPPLLESAADGLLGIGEIPVREGLPADQGRHRDPVHRDRPFGRRNLR